MNGTVSRLCMTKKQITRFTMLMLGSLLQVADFAKGWYASLTRLDQTSADTPADPPSASSSARPDSGQAVAVRTGVPPDRGQPLSLSAAITVSRWISRSYDSPSATGKSGDGTHPTR